MKKILKVIIILFCFIFLILIFRYFLNEYIIKKYNSNDYNTSFSKILYFLNYNEKYIYYYNQGNILYQKSDFKTAENNYRKALNYYIPENRICNVDYNFALSIVRQTELISDDKKIKKFLINAENILTKHKCAMIDGKSGEDINSQDLYNQIEEYLNSESSEDNDETDNNKEVDNETTSVEEELSEREKNATKSRNESIDNSLSDYSFYNGKKW